jgi:hypothetical protein
MRRIALGLAALAVGIARCGSSSTRTVTVRAASSTATTSSTVVPASGITTVTLPDATTAPPAALPILVTNAWSGVKPSEIDFSADGGNIVTGISWQSWSAAGAVGFGSSGIQNCIPNCAQGKTKFVPTTVTLSAASGGHFTHIVEARNGTTLTAGYMTTFWPIGAR